MKETLAPLTAAEWAWIKEQLAGARAFVDDFSPEDAGEPVSLGSLERAFAGWAAAKESDPQRIEAAISVVAVCFGQILVRKLGLQWVRVVGDESAELALHGLPGKGDVLVFPRDLVTKRWQQGQRHFLAAAFRQIAAHVAALAWPAP